MGCSGHAPGCHTETSAGVGRKEEGFAREDIDEDSEVGTHLYVKMAFVLLYLWHIHVLFVLLIEHVAADRLIG
jgi:hypothetical protein